MNKEKPELKCNGKCHLASQLSLDNTEDETPSYLASFFEAFFPVYFKDYKLNHSTVIIKNSWFYSSQYTSLYIECLDPPPQV
ncbi:hypothetical protein [uncultured Lacinutrix sp.]|uniref:hypothetical protein n=1 Tax=uncultured Lacinutrix sp. TaxID=574032 RepID=UPI00260DB151|nr:hypothetical protein [uncultured Lacinutrix sp.]